MALARTLRPHSDGSNVPLLQGHVDALYNLGHLYHNGKGVTQDHRKAIKFFKGAALGGHVLAMNNMGGMHLKGLGTKRNIALGYVWINLAAK